MAAEHHLTFGPFRLELAQGRLWQGAAGAELAPAPPGAAAVSGRASRAPGDQSRDAAARVGRDACQRYCGAGVCAGDSGGVGRCGRCAAVSRNRWTAGLSVARGTTGSSPHWWRRAHRARSLGARPKWNSWEGSSSRRPTGPGRSSCSVTTLGWARRRWSRCGSPARERGVRSGWRRASALFMVNIVGHLVQQRLVVR